MTFEFEQLTPDYPDALIPCDQLVVFQIDIHTIKVVVHFMLNAGLSIESARADSALGTVYLSVVAKSASGGICASSRAQKVCFTFPEAQGMASNFDFKIKTKF